MIIKKIYIKIIITKKGAKSGKRGKKTVSICEKMSSVQFLHLSVYSFTVCKCGKKRGISEGGNDDKGPEGPQYDDKP